MSKEDVVKHDFNKKLEGQEMRDYIAKQFPNWALTDLGGKKGREMTIDEYRKNLPARRDRHRERQRLAEQKQDRFDRKLEELLNKDGVNPIVFAIPGVYELIAEDYNNAVLKALEEEKEDD